MLQEQSERAIYIVFGIGYRRLSQLDLTQYLRGISMSRVAEPQRILPTCEATQPEKTRYTSPSLHRVQRGI